MLHCPHLSYAAFSPTSFIAHLGTSAAVFVLSSHSSIWVGTVFLSLPLLRANSWYYGDLLLGTSLFSLIILSGNGSLTEQYIDKKKIAILIVSVIKFRCWPNGHNWAIKKSLIASLDSDLIAPMVAVRAQVARGLASSCGCTQAFKLVSSFSWGVSCW